MILQCLAIGSSLSFLIFGIYSYKKASEIKTEKTATQYKLQETYKCNIENLESEIANLFLQKGNLEQKISSIQNQINKAQQQFTLIKSSHDKESIQLNNQFQAQKEYIRIKYQQMLEGFNKEIAEAEIKLSQEQEKINAVIAAELRKEQIKEKENYYRLQIPEEDLQNMEKIKNCYHLFKDPHVLQISAWTAYYNTPANQLCSRVLGKKDKVSGIYRITSTATGRSYIGQAVDVKDRWREHMKCGLGIGKTDSKLYKAMLEQGVQNFTFQLLEEVPKAKLDERERFYIDTYQTAEFGYNTTKGNGGRK